MRDLSVSDSSILALYVSRSLSPGRQGKREDLLPCSTYTCHACNWFKTVDVSSWDMSRSPER